MKRILPVLCVGVVLGAVALWLMRSGSHSPGASVARTRSPSGARGTSPTNLPLNSMAGEHTATSVASGVARTPAQAFGNQLGSSPGQQRSQQVRTGWSPDSVWTEQVAMDSSLAGRLDAVMKSWRLVVDLQDKRSGPTTLAEAHGLLWESINMALDGAPRRSVEHRGVFFFSGGTKAYRVDDFSSGRAIPKGKAAIYEWGN